jgi:hypothetical protein
VDYESIALMVVKVMKIPEPWIISIDRTDWQFGKHGRLPKSIFRLGFDFLRPIIFDLHLNSEAFFNSIKFLSCT